MTEKEKAAKGLVYNPNIDPLLQQEMKQARIKTYKYNLLSPEKEEEKKSLLKELLGKTGENYTIISPFYCDYGYNIEIGENFFANMNLVILDGAKVTIGNNVFIAPNVGIYTAGHQLDPKERAQGLEYAYPVSIGNDVWIGGNTVILPGINIGDNCVIGAGSVVTKDIPANSMAVGNPCKVIRQAPPNLPTGKA